jgi:hypothetical protein
VTVSDPKITPSSNSCALLAPTETCVLVGTYVVTAADVTAGQIDNLATGDTDQTDPVTDPETVPVPTPSLGIGRFLTPAQSVVGPLSARRLRLQVLRHSR